MAIQTPNVHRVVHRHLRKFIGRTMSCQMLIATSGVMLLLAGCGPVATLHTKPPTLKQTPTVSAAPSNGLDAGSMAWATTVQADEQYLSDYIAAVEQDLSTAVSRYQAAFDAGQVPDPRMWSTFEDNLTTNWRRALDNFEADVSGQVPAAFTSVAVALNGALFNLDDGFSITALGVPDSGVHLAAVTQFNTGITQMGQAMVALQALVRP
jgi:hypothetical protein